MVSLGSGLGTLDGESDVDVGVLVHERNHHKHIPGLSAARTYLCDCTFASFAIPRRAGIILCLA